MQEPIKKWGKHAERWRYVRAKWLLEHPPNHEGYYFCYICGRAMTREEVTLDHMESRSRRPHLRYDENNLAPCCGPCNNEKGSLSVVEYKNLKERKLAARKPVVPDVAANEYNDNLSVSPPDIPSTDNPNNFPT